ACRRCKNPDREPRLFGVSSLLQIHVQRVELRPSPTKGPLQSKNAGRKVMSRTGRLVVLSSIGLAALLLPASAADVTAQRLLNAPADPQNWLMVHHDYNNSRHSPLAEINRANAGGLKLKFIAAIGGTATGGTMRGKEEGTPLVDDGFMYVADT